MTVPLTNGVSRDGSEPLQRPVVVVAAAHLRLFLPFNLISLRSHAASPTSPTSPFPHLPFLLAVTLPNRQNDQDALSAPFPSYAIQGEKGASEEARQRSAGCMMAAAAAMQLFYKQRGPKRCTCVAAAARRSGKMWIISNPAVALASRQKGMSAHACVHRRSHACVFPLMRAPPMCASTHVRGGARQ